MKKIICSIIGLLFIAISMGKTSDKEFQMQDSITPPEFMIEKVNWAGDDIVTLTDYLKRMIQYPDVSIREQQMGTVVADFVVTSEGKLSKLRIINSVSEEIDEEMIRILEETEGMWKPGLINGMPAPLKKEVSLAFVPGDQFDLVEIAKEAFAKGNEEMFVKNRPSRALGYYDKAVMMLPYDIYILSIRSLCKNELGDKMGARDDWERVFQIGLGDAGQLETGLFIRKPRNLR
jgi:hypothetical protein